MIGYCMSPKKFCQTKLRVNQKFHAKRLNLWRDVETLKISDGLYIYLCPIKSQLSERFTSIEEKIDFYVQKFGQTLKTRRDIF